MDGTSRVRLDTWRQKVRLALGLLTVLALVALFVVAALVTADTTATQVGAWTVAALLLAFALALGYGGLLAVRPQALVVSGTGIAREAPRRSWLVGCGDAYAPCVEMGNARVAMPCRRRRS